MHESFFKSLILFKERQNLQKQRGLNNYNIFTSVLKYTDEVKLHSAMLVSLLNIDGEHYQGDLFLRYFIDLLNIRNFSINTKNCKIYKEYSNIDIYITDGLKHIMLENKVNAGDQKAQIKRYIDTIFKNHPKINQDDILVVYLSPDKREPSKHSLLNLTISHNYIQDGNKKIAHYKSISYKKEIIEWLKLCQFEIQNITNLNEAIKQYMDVVKMINGNYKDKVMSISDFIRKDKDTYKIALEVQDAISSARKDIIEDFFTDISQTLDFKLGSEWVIKLETNLLHRKYNLPLSIYKESWSNCHLMFCYDFDNNNYCDGYFGIVRSDERINIKDDLCVNFQQQLEQLGIEIKSTDGWLHWDWLPNTDLSLPEYIMFNDDPKDKFINAIIDIISKFELNTNLVTTINKYLSNNNN